MLVVLSAPGFWFGRQLCTDRFPNNALWSLYVYKVNVVVPFGLKKVSVVASAIQNHRTKYPRNKLYVAICEENCFERPCVWAPIVRFKVKLVDVNQLLELSTITENEMNAATENCRYIFEI